MKLKHTRVEQSQWQWRIVGCVWLLATVYFLVEMKLSLSDEMMMMRKNEW